MSEARHVVELINIPADFTVVRQTRLEYNELLEIK